MGRLFLEFTDCNIAISKIVREMKDILIDYDVYDDMDEFLKKNSNVIFEELPIEHDDFVDFISHFGKVIAALSGFEGRFICRAVWSLDDYEELIEIDYRDQKYTQKTVLNYGANDETEEIEYGKLINGRIAEVDAEV